MEIARWFSYLLYVSNFSLGSSGQPIQRDVSRLGNDLLFASGDQVRCAGFRWWYHSLSVKPRQALICGPDLSNLEGTSRVDGAQFPPLAIAEPPICHSKVFKVPIQGPGCRHFLTCWRCLKAQRFMGCGWCGDRCGRQKECPASWQQDHCPPEITEVQPTPQGSGNRGTSRAVGRCQKVLVTIFRALKCP